MRKRFLLGAACAAAATLGVAMAGAPAASAYDSAPCKAGAKRTFSWAGTPWKETLFQCSTWRNDVPVYAAPDPGSRVIGHLKSRSNWYLFEFKGRRLDVGRNWNTWWASTKADASTVVPGADGWGYVNEVYFRGGKNDEDDRGLLQPGPVTCAETPTASSCPTELPPWRFPRGPRI
jgi:hypothetical protein